MEKTSKNLQKKACKWVAVGCIVTAVANVEHSTKTKNHRKNKINTNVPQENAKYTLPMDYFERKLDDKRRLTIPTELRAEFASGVVISRGFGVV